MLAPLGMLTTLKVKESLSEAVTFTNATSPRVTSMHLGTYVNFGGKLSAKNGLKRFNLYPKLDKSCEKVRQTGTEGQKILLLGHYHFLSAYEIKKRESCLKGLLA